ncbi:HEAT repeat domain-containing protein [Streptomyces sp. NBC_01336]|uniref:HEAT repeat domain-containing protein n=1 Tax=Streptomyces sp. NBC_01336 TaxID=2903829 RepID=UPI002E129AB8|nr:HEAT repeat domain-containing protein [Streptomyces sp. NBC_01336]
MTEADPETTEALCLAVAAFDGRRADALLDAGADPLRPLPDGSTPLLRAVASGNAGVTVALLRHAEGRLTKEERTALLFCARHWYETSAEAGLRLATGASGPVESRRFVDDFDGNVYHVITLGGMRVCDGHSAVLTRLEAEFGFHRSFDDLFARALARADGEHADWWEATLALAKRSDVEAWEATLALRSDADPLRRRFAADLVWCFLIVEHSAPSGEWPWERLAVDVLLPWAAEETDPAVLVSVLRGLDSVDVDDPKIEEVGLTLRTHPDPRVRVQVPRMLRRTRHTYTHPEALDVLATLARDPDARVRGNVCEVLYEFEGRSPAVADILAGFLDEDDQLVRIKAVSGLADADDPRCVEGARLIGPVDRADQDTWLLDAAERYAQRRTAAAGS